MFFFIKGIFSFFPLQSSGFFQSEEQANLAQQLCSALTQALIKYQQNKRGIGAAPAPQNSSNFLPTNFPRAPSNAQPMPGRFPPPASPAFSTVSANSTLPIATVKHSFRVPSSVRPALDHNAVGNSWLPVSFFIYRAKWREGRVAVRFPCVSARHSKIRIRSYFPTDWVK